MKHLPLFALSAILGLSACSLLGGPSGKQIEDLARQGMIDGVSGADPVQRAAFTAAAQSAKISKRGFCNTAAVKGPDKTTVYACAVDITVKLPGAASETTQTNIVEITKAADGSWKTVG